MAAYAYVVTPLGVDAESEAVRTQRAAIEAYAAAGDVLIDDWVIDDAADCFEARGKHRARFLFDRPAGKRLADALQPGDLIIVSNLGALGLSKKELLRLFCELELRGAELRFPRTDEFVVSWGLNTLVSGLAA